MPELDFAILADYVRAERGIGHLVAGGIDTIWLDQVPGGQNMGLLLRIDFKRSECGRPHRVEIFVQDEDGERLVQVVGTLTPEWDDSLPVTWRAKALIAFNFGVPLARFGIYDIEIVIDDQSVKTMPLRVLQGQRP